MNKRQEKSMVVVESYDYILTVTGNLLLLKAQLQAMLIDNKQKSLFPRLFNSPYIKPPYCIYGSQGK